MESPAEALTVFNLNQVEQKVSRQIQKLEAQLYQHVAEFGKSALGIGQILTEINALLEPRGMFTQYLNRLPWLSPRTAYRYMGAYKRSKELLPPAVVEKALVSGIHLFSYNDETPFGRYTEAMKHLPAPPTREADADMWLVRLQTEARKYHPTVAIPEIDRIAKMLYLAWKRTPDAPPFSQWLHRVSEKALALSEGEIPILPPPIRTRRATHQPARHRAPHIH